MTMPPKCFQYQIVALNASVHQRNRYQLQITELNQYGYPLQRAQWQFQTLRGLLAFLEKHFPNSTLQNPKEKLCIQFQTLRSSEPANSAAEIAASHSDMPKQLHPDREIYSTQPDQMIASCG